jgi:hypothetical protein
MTWRCGESIREGERERERTGNKNKIKITHTKIDRYIYYVPSLLEQVLSEDGLLKSKHVLSYMEA